MRAFFFFSGMEAQSDEVEEEYCWAIAQAAERSSRGRLISRFSESGLQLDSPVYTTYSWHAVGLPCVHYIQLTLSWTPLCTLHTADTQLDSPVYTTYSWHSVPTQAKCDLWPSGPKLLR